VCVALQMQASSAAEAAAKHDAEARGDELHEVRRQLAVAHGRLSVAEGLEAQVDAANEQLHLLREQCEVGAKASA
jgi:hypothetical protein